MLDGIGVAVVATVIIFEHDWVLVLLLVPCGICGVVFAVMSEASFVGSILSILTLV